MGFPGRAPPLARKDTVRGWKGEPIGGAGWPPQPALGAAYTDTRRFRAEMPTASPVHKHPAHKQWRPLAPRCGDRVLHGRVAPRRDPAPHSQALRAKTPRPTAQRSAPRPRAPRPGGSTHFRLSSRFRYLTAFQGLNHRAPAPRRLHRLRRLGSTCARARAPVQKGCVGCARARAEGVRGLRARPCSRGTCTARAPLQKGCVGCARACVEGVRGLRARPCRRGAHACTRVSHIYGESHGWDSRGRAVSPSPSRRLHSALARCGEGFGLGAESAPCGCRPFAAPTLGFGPPPVK